MTTGRINQVTIVRRGWPLAATSATREFQVTGRHLLDRSPEGSWLVRCAPRQRLRPGRGCRAGQSAFPLFIPQGFLPPHLSPKGSVAWGPQEVGHPPNIIHDGVSVGVAIT